MKLRSTKLSILGIALLLMIGVISCKDQFTEEDLAKQQTDAKQAELKTVSGSDSLKFLLALNEQKYVAYKDSIARADSISIAQGKLVYLPYTYELQVINGSEASSTNGRTENTAAFVPDVTVTITQYGVKQTKVAKDGLFTFKNIGVGAIHGTINAPGYTTFEFVVDASLPYQLFKEAVSLIPGATGGTGGAGGGTGGTGTVGSPYLTNAYYLEALLQYFNQRSFGNDFPIFATAGPTTSNVVGRAFIETNLTNRVKEVAAGAQIVASIDVDNAAFKARFLIDPSATSNVPANTAPITTGNLSLNSIFNPTSWAIGYLGTATTDANGDYSINVPGSPDGLPVRVEISDVVADKTYFIESNGDVTQVTRRNIYGPGITGDAVPNMTLAPTITFDAGSGATATAKISGNGSVTDLDLTAGGKDFIGVPRLIISPPTAAGGTQATGTATVVGGVVTDVTLVNGGSGYTALPSVTITEGAGATVALDNTSGFSGFVVNSSNGGVVNVTVTGSGGNYAVAPNVVFFVDLNSSGTFNAGEQLTTANFPTGVSSGGFFSGTDFPTGTAVFNTGSSTAVSSVTVTNSGGGLSFQPGVLISSGQGAVLAVTTAGGLVTAVTITNGGLFYTSVPSISLPVGTFGTPTTAAVLTPTLTNGVITAVAITNAGVGYTNVAASTAAVITPVGNGAAGTVVWEGLGVSAAKITNAGAIQPDGIFYSIVPKIVVSKPEYQGPGSAVATAVAVLGQDGRLVGVNITNAGFGYTGGVPTFTVVAGSGATANPKFADKALQAIEVVLGGSGYIVAPKVLVTDPSNSGSGATAVANILNGVITSIDVTAAGSGYINGANVVILDPGTSYDANAGVAPSGGTGTANSGRYVNAAGANVFVLNGIVVSVEVYQSGDSYPTGTRVKIVSSKGSGFTATTTVVNGKLGSVAVTTGGTGYVGNNYYRGIGVAINPTKDVVVLTSGALAFSTDFTGTNPGPYTYDSKSGIKRVKDVEYGSGKNKN